MSGSVRGRREGGSGGSGGERKSGKGWRGNRGNKTKEQRGTGGERRVRETEGLKGRRLMEGERKGKGELLKRIGDGRAGKG